MPLLQLTMTELYPPCLGLLPRQIGVSGYVFVCARVLLYVCVCVLCVYIYILVCVCVCVNVGETKTDR